MTDTNKVDVEPYGCVTVVKREGIDGDTHFFYRHPKPPYLDNALECITVYSASALAALCQENERLKSAFDEWMDKTAWTVKEVQPKELGMHRADIARQRFEAERADNKRLRKALETARLRLKVGMPEYDASDVLDAIENALKGEQK